MKFLEYPGRTNTTRSLPVQELLQLALPNAATAQSYLMVTQPFPQTFPAITGRAWAVLGRQLAPGWLRGKSPELEMSPAAQVMSSAALPMASLSSLVWVARGGSLALSLFSCLSLSHLAGPHTDCLTFITSLAPGVT